MRVSGTKLQLGLSEMKELGSTLVLLRATVNSHHQTDQSLAKILWQLFKRAGWAPFLVVVVHRVVLLSGLRQFRVCDWLLHFFGGVTIAYFLFHVIDLLRPRLGELSRTGHLALTYTAACTVAAFWELAEFAASLLKGIEFQDSIAETMIDLFNGCLGAALMVVFLRIFGGRSRDLSLVDRPHHR